MHVVDDDELQPGISRRAVGRAMRAAKGIDGPVLVLDHGQIESALRGLRKALPGTSLHYAVKCNPHPLVLRTVAEAGCSFEFSSLAELQQLLDLGVSAPDLLFSAPVKIPSHIAAAFTLGVQRFAFDSRDELAKLACYAPKAQVFARLAVNSTGSRLPLSSKFGLTGEEAVSLLVSARSAGLDPIGLTFHVGSQASNCSVWPCALADVSRAMGTLLADHDLRLQMIDIGGGFPVAYGEAVPSIYSIGRLVKEGVEKLPYQVALVAEPGRYIVAKAGTLVTTVIGVAERGATRWVYLDAGPYNALMEALPDQGGFRFPVGTTRVSRGGDVPTVLAGPTCDGNDVFAHRVLLPADLDVGDQVIVGHAGAYTQLFSASFCSFDGPSVVSTGLADSVPMHVVPDTLAGRI